MRINKIDLIRFGKFTNVSLEFPNSISDIHIIFGPNEAGKSTSLTAIEDLLFGIPHNSPYNFVHDYANMRVGGVLQHGEQSLEVHRRKGNRDTLLGQDEMPLLSGDGTLRPFLGGADQTFFTRMFSLNHERLAKGGREILEAKDDVGQMLFSASAGLAGLREQIAALAKEADGLWAPRRAGHRKYYKALDALEEAEKALREHTITASKWHETKRVFDAAQEAYNELEQKIESCGTEQRKLSRIRRVYRAVCRLTELNEENINLGEVVLLPDDADMQLEKAKQEELNAHSKIEELTEQLAHATAERTKLTCNETIILRADDIQQLHKERIEVQKEKVDLPRRRAELAIAETKLQDLAEELGWKAEHTDDILSRIPQRVKVTVIRTLLTSRGEYSLAIKNAKGALEEAEEQVEELQRELNESPNGLDVSALATVIGVTRELGDLGSRIKVIEKEAGEIKVAIQNRIKSFRPEVTNEQTLVETTVPSRMNVQNHREGMRELEQKIKSFRERIRTTEQDLVRNRKAYERLVRDEEAVASEELSYARKKRDTGWSLIRKRYIEGGSVPEEELSTFVGNTDDLPKAYEDSIEGADILADRRFDKAQAAAQIIVITRHIAEHQESLDSLQEEEKALNKELQELKETWQTLWINTLFEPHAPDVMLEWLEARDDVLNMIERSLTTNNHLKTLQEEESAAKSLILVELAKLGEEIDNLKKQSLRIALETGSMIQQQHEKKAEKRAALENSLRRAQADETRKRSKLEKAENDWGEWERQWASALSELGLDIDVVPDVIADQLDTIDEMRAINIEINQLQNERIGKIERDIKSFSTSVAELVNAVASDLIKTEPEDAVLQLEKRLDEAKRISEQQEEKDKAIVSLRKRIKECEETKKSAQNALRELQEVAGVQEIFQLKEAINKSRRRQGLDNERNSLKETLYQEGDGLPLAEVLEECEGVNLDQIATKEETLRAELNDVRNHLIEATEKRAQARQAFEAFGGDDRAAQAAAEKQEALAAMRDIGEQYVRVRTAATLLQWAIDRYRREKQAPLLKRAGQIFSTLTLGSFNDLRVEFDDQDHPHLVGIRPDGVPVNVGGMSDGTADQLYLALRLASVDEYLSQSHSLPFVVDDLFINFDDDRAAAGFKVLAQLGQKTQVLFFTHHRHLVEIAQANLGASINIITLTENKVVSQPEDNGIKIPIT